jgi:hypothetical protein
MELRFWNRRRATSEFDDDRWRCHGCGLVYRTPARPEFTDRTGHDYCSWNCIVVARREPRGRA